jgi:ubiquinone/menaquinone biosynthesis C-methylase UbiE
MSVSVPLKVIMMPRSNKESNNHRFDEDFFDSGKQVPGGFSCYSFDKYFAVFKPLCRIIVNHFNPKRVLDVGCAKGSMVCAFRDLGIDAFGVDVSQYAISSAPAFLQSFLYVVDLDHDSLPFEDGSFDFVTFLGAIEYLRDHRHAIAELERVMVDGGSLLLTTIFKRPKGDVYRLNVHTKSTWLKEFGKRWSASSVYPNFMGAYFSNSATSSSVLDKAKRLLFGKSRFGDRFLCFLYDLFVRLHLLTYGVILLTLHKNGP